ncbi:hypothetical protein Patl1_03145 [Pistacia atlantica]|uniref:Uncharacterized protein n=1 Tax=Pistacia atlantica TaxID=434234 RepID=A0ACC1C6Z7_9ROSI|nr:hypothetical protein Patl1_03145 [Pistacia atlantica]
MEANFLAELGHKTKVPYISFSASDTYPSSNRFSYLVQITQDGSSEAIGITAIVESFKCRVVIIIYKDRDDCKGYAWIMTANSMNCPHFTREYDTSSMQGVIGLKSYIPPSKDLKSFSLRWRKKFLLETNMEVMELNTICVWAYDVVCGLAMAAERARPKISLIQNQDSTLNWMDLEDINTAVAAHVNVIGRHQRRLGFWAPVRATSRTVYSYRHGRQLSSSSDLEGIVWPGGSAKIPEEYAVRSDKKFRIGVIPNPGFPELVNVDHDFETNVTSITGFCIDVFSSTIETLHYEVDYEFIPYPNAWERNNGTFRELVHQMYVQDFDAAVGDITITLKRSLYDDFTLPYTDMGVGIIAPKDSKNMWIFLKPLTTELWLSSAGFFILTGLVIWLIERRINNEFQVIQMLNLQPFRSPEEDANALSRGSKKGGVSAIIDEIPYIKIFLARYSADYSMITSTSSTNGFGFVFRKGSPLVSDMSNAIPKLRENGRLIMLENLWFQSHQSTFTSEDASNNVNLLLLIAFVVYS